MADGDLAVRAVDQDRLGIRELALAGRRVADVADRQRPGQVRQLVVVERVGDVAHRPGHTHLLAVGGGDAGALLPAVLERVQAEIRHVGRLGVAEDAEDAALFPELVKHQATLRMKCRSTADRPDPLELADRRVDRQLAANRHHGADVRRFCRSPAPERPSQPPGRGRPRPCPATPKRSRATPTRRTALPPGSGAARAQSQPRREKHRRRRSPAPKQHSASVIARPPSEQS